MIGGLKFYGYDNYATPRRGSAQPLLILAYTFFMPKSLQFFVHGPEAKPTSECSILSLKARVGEIL